MPSIWGWLFDTICSISSILFLRCALPAFQWASFIPLFCLFPFFALAALFFSFADSQGQVYAGSDGLYGDDLHGCRHEYNQPVWEAGGQGDGDVHNHGAREVGDHAADKIEWLAGNIGILLIRILVIKKPNVKIAQIPMRDKVTDLSLGLADEEFEEVPVLVENFVEL